MKIPVIRHALMIALAALSFAAIAALPHFFTGFGAAQGAEIPAVLLFFSSIYLLGLIASGSRGAPDRNRPITC